MKFDPSFLDEIRTRISPSQWIKRSVKLKHTGREYLGLCPFHKENTPSFTVNDDKGFYHCFGCGAHGDVIKFAMDNENLNFVDAVKMLANHAGMELPQENPAEAKRYKKQKTLTELLDFTSLYYEHSLQSASGEHALSYLIKRGLKEATIKKFRIGYAEHNSTQLRNELTKHEFNPKLMHDAGLVKKGTGGDEYDYFRNRVMFPICNPSGKVIAFGGRILGDGQPKYLNSPETEVFKKNQILYNEHHARKLAAKYGKLVVVEGYMDVIALDNAGIKTAVAPLGTALTQNHLNRLWTLVAEPVLCFDGDNAGKRAMERAINMALPLLKPGFSLFCCQLPHGKDPDDVLTEDGTTAMKELLRAAKPLSQMVWELTKNKYDLSTPERFAQLEHELKQLCEKIENSSVKYQYQKYFNDNLRQLNKNHHFKGHRLTSRLADIRQSDLIDYTTIEGCELGLALIMIHQPNLLDDDDILETYVTIDFSASELDNIRTCILQERDSGETINIQRIASHLNDENDRRFLEKMLKKRLFSLNEDLNDAQMLLQGWNYLIKRYNLALLKKECQALEMEMNENSQAHVTELKNEIAHLLASITKLEIEFGGDA